MLNEKRLERLSSAKIYLKALRRYRHELDELRGEREDAISIAQAEAISLRMEAIEEVLGEFMAKIYVLGRHDRKLIETYIEADSYAEMLDMLEKRLGMSEQQYRTSISRIAFEIDRLCNTDRYVGTMIKERIELLSSSKDNG